MHTEISRATGGNIQTDEPLPSYRTIEQFSERHPAFTPPALRNLIFKASPRQSSKGEIPGNGLILFSSVEPSKTAANSVLVRVYG